MPPPLNGEDENMSGGESKPSKPKKVSFDDVPLVLNESPADSRPPVDVAVASHRTGIEHYDAAKKVHTRKTARLVPSVHLNHVNKINAVGGNKVRQRTSVDVQRVIDRSHSTLGNRLRSGSAATNLAPVVDQFPNNGHRSGNTYAKPELNSALQLAERLQRINLERFDPAKAVRKKLDASPKTRNKFIAKSTKPVNFLPSMATFKDVLPLEFDEEQLLHRLAKEQEAKLRNDIPAPRPKDPQPLLEEFLTEDLQPEFVAVPLPSIAFPSLRQPSISSSVSAYSLYKHKRMWEGLP